MVDAAGKGRAVAITHIHIAPLHGNHCHFSFMWVPTVETVIAQQTLREEESTLNKQRLCKVRFSHFTVFYHYTLHLESQNFLTYKLP